MDTPNQESPKGPGPLRTYPQDPDSVLQFQVVSPGGQPDNRKLSYVQAVEYLQAKVADPDFVTSVTALRTAVSRKLLGCWKYNGNVRFTPQQLDIYLRRVVRLVDPKPQGGQS